MVQTCSLHSGSHEEFKGCLPPCSKIPPKYNFNSGYHSCFLFINEFFNTKDPISKVQKAGYWERERFYLLDSGLQSLVGKTFLYFSKNITEYKTTLYSLPQELRYCYRSSGFTVTVLTKAQRGSH